MTICDCCKSTTGKFEVFQISIQVRKHEILKASKLTRKIQRRIIQIDYHLCDKCITTVCRNLGNLKNRILENV